MNTISRTSKLNARSWSLQARDTCPGHIAAGEIVDACRGCYATHGNYYLPVVIQARARNRDAWTDPAWVDTMVAELDEDRYFRWFDSGDMYSLELAVKIYEVMRRTPWCQHWLPTRMHKFTKFHPVLEQMWNLPNVRVRFSSDSVEGDFEHYHGSTIVSNDSQLREGVYDCPSRHHGGNCGGCRACWDKTVPVVAYRAHGNKMRGVIKIVAARAESTV